MKILFACTIVFLFGSTASLADTVAVPKNKNAVRYITAVCVQFNALIMGAYKKVCAAEPYSAMIAETEKDAKEFEMGFWQMANSNGEELPNTSWLDAVTFTGTQRVHIRLSDGDTVYAIGTGRDFKEAWKNLTTNFAQ